MNFKKWSENAPIAVVSGILGTLITFLLGSVTNILAFYDRAEERSKAPQAHISELDTQYRDKIDITLTLANPTSGSTSFSDFMLNVQHCRSNVITTYPKYTVVSQGKVLVPSPVNVPSKQKATTTLAFSVSREGEAPYNSITVCRVSVAWFDENSDRQETKPLVFNSPIAHYRASGAVP